MEDLEALLHDLQSTTAALRRQAKLKAAQQQEQQGVEQLASPDDAYLAELGATGLNGQAQTAAAATDEHDLDPCVQLCAHGDDKEPDYEPQSALPNQGGYIETTTTTKTTTITCIESPNQQQGTSTAAVAGVGEVSQAATADGQAANGAGDEEDDNSAAMATTRNFSGLDDLEALLDDYDKQRYTDGSVEVRREYHTAYSSSGGENRPARSANRPTVESLLGQLDINTSTRQQQQQSNGGAQLSPTSGERSPGGTLRARFSKSPTGELTYTWSRKSPGPQNADLKKLHERDYAQQHGRAPARKLSAEEGDFVDAPEVPVRERARQYEQHVTTTTSTTSTAAAGGGGEGGRGGMEDPLDSMLGTLSADMVKHGISTIPKGECAACAKTIVGQVVIALGKMWHPEHFVCVHCGEELGERNFYERAGRAYCEADYHDLFAPRCAHCDGPIKDRCVTALDRTWHVDHFFCAQCGADFGEDGFHEKDGKAFCRQCYFSMFAPRCHGCKKAIQTNYITALNTQWHPECFVCQGDTHFSRVATAASSYHQH